MPIVMALCGVAAGFVEAQLAFLADADHQQVQAAGQFVEGRAIVGDFRLRNGPVGDVDVFREDVHLVDQRLVEAVVAALGFVAGRGVIFIDGDNLHVAERHLAGPEAARELFVERRRRDAGREAQAEPPARFLVDGRDDQVGHGRCGRPGFGVNVSPDLLVVVQNAAREVLLDQASFVR